MHFAHIGFAVTDLAKSKPFYAAALAPVGIALEREKSDSLHFGIGNERTMLWVHTRAPVSGPFHIAFEAENKTQVDDFHAAALTAGGTDNGKPGMREDYSPNYYAAFVLDPDGNNVEVVYRG